MANLKNRENLAVWAAVGRKRGVARMSAGMFMPGTAVSSATECVSVPQLSGGQLSKPEELHEVGVGFVLRYGLAWAASCR
jgi:hypothetical protein